MKQKLLQVLLYPGYQSAEAPVVFQQSKYEKKVILYPVSIIKTKVIIDLEAKEL